MRRLVWLPALIVSVCAAAPAPAAPLYTITFQDQPVSSLIPFHRDTTFALYTSNGTGEATGRGMAGHGFVSAYQSISTNWASGFSGGNTCQNRSVAQATDFMISGPGGSVTGTLHCRVIADFQHLGGFAGHGGHGSTILVRVDITGYGYNYATALASLSVTNFGPNGTGFLAGQTGPHIDVPFDLTATVPANAPLNLFLTIESSGYTYGNVNTNPGFVEADGGGSNGDHTGRGLRLDGSSGVVMTVPAGYTVSVPSWGIFNSTFDPAAVERGTPGGAMRFELAGANPSTGETRVTMALPRDGFVRVVLLDVAGRVQRTLVNEWRAAGVQTIAWDGRTETGASAPAGLYFMRAESQGERATQRLIRMR